MYRVRMVGCGAGFAPQRGVLRRHLHAQGQHERQEPECIPLQGAPSLLVASTHNVQTGTEDLCRKNSCQRKLPWLLAVGRVAAMWAPYQGPHTMLLWTCSVSPFEAALPVRCASAADHNPLHLAPEFGLVHNLVLCYVMHNLMHWGAFCAEPNRDSSPEDILYHQLLGLCANSFAHHLYCLDCVLPHRCVNEVLQRRMFMLWMGLGLGFRDGEGRARARGWFVQLQSGRGG